LDGTLPYLSKPVKVSLDLAPCFFKLVAATSPGQSLGRSR